MGVEVVQTDAGLEVTFVLNKSPAARDDSRLQVGDVITQAINNRSKTVLSLMCVITAVAGQPTT